MAREDFRSVLGESMPITDSGYNSGSLSASKEALDIESSTSHHLEEDVSSSSDGRPTASAMVNEPIAIIGMAYHFPGGADNPDALWKILSEKKCTASEFPQDRFNIDAFWSGDASAKRKVNPREAHFLDGDIANFDAGFFSMAPHEVGSMDPQQRGLLESTYHALENSGITLEEASGTNTSVHIGCFTNDFAHLQLRDTQNIPKYNAIGSAGSILANRLSWFFNLHGESMYIDTACSSSLVALSVACRGLSAGTSDMAIVGASNLIIGPEFNIALSNLNFLSPSGRCKSFDASGDGYGRGEGFTTMVLKPVSKAIADGNSIRAVIRGFGMNQDGHTSGGITQPSKEMQIRLIKDTYQQAGLSMCDTRFFEAHGTGTAVGDPIEAGAIGEAFFKHRSKNDPMYVGAIKSNFGHLEGTSGLAAVVKVALAVERGVIPPNTNFTRLNPMIDADFLNLQFPQQCIPWPAAQTRRASVNSFGFGGSNAHIVIDSADDYLRSLGRQQSAYRFPLLQADLSNGILPGPQSVSQSLPKLLVLSAADADGIGRQAKSLASFSSRHTSKSIENDDALLTDILWNLNTRRSSHAWKSCAVVKGFDDFSKCEELMSKPIREGQGAAPNIGFVFTGQGAQWPRMGIELLKWPVFRKSLIFSQSVLASLGCEWDIIEELKADKEASNIQDPEFSQTISTVVQIGLVHLTEFLDIRPEAVVGHSSGEISAAFCAGLLSHDSAVRVAYYRGKLASTLARNQTSTRHGMASLGVSAEQAVQELKELETRTEGMFKSAETTISCINSPVNTTISGPVAMLDLIVKDFSARELFARQLKVDLGYHSPQMNAISTQYLKLLSDLTPRYHEEDLVTKMVSSVTASRLDAATACSAEYWVQNMVSPVQFVKAMQMCHSFEGEKVKKIDQSHNSDVYVDGWLEIGPHSAMQGPTRDILKTCARGSRLYTSLISRGKPALETALEAFGALHCNSFQVNIAKLSSLDTERARHHRQVLDLPKYSFNHTTTYWEESQRSKGFRKQKHAYNPLVGAPVIDWNPLDAKWRWTLRTEDVPWVTEHQINGSIIFPAAGMIVMAIEGIRMVLENQASLKKTPVGFELREILFLSPLILSDSPSGTDIQLSMVPVEDAGSPDAQYKFRIFVLRSDDAWQETCKGLIRADFGYLDQDVSASNVTEDEIFQWRAQYNSNSQSCKKHLDAPQMYEKVSLQSGLQYGPSFQPLTDIRYNDEGVACAKVLAFPQPTTTSHIIHPATLDGIFQLSIPALSKGLEMDLPTLVPARLTRLWVAESGAGHSSSLEDSQEVAYSESHFRSRRTAQSSMKVFTSSDLKPRVIVEELGLAEMARESQASQSGTTGHPLCYEMDWKPDHSILSHAEIQQICSKNRSEDVEPIQFYEDIELMLVCSAAQTLEHLAVKGLKPIESMTRYVSWLRACVDTYISQSKPEAGTDPKSFVLDPATLSSAIEAVESKSSRGFVNATVVRNLQDILLGQVDPLRLLFEDEDFLPTFYEELNTAGKAFSMLTEYIDLLVHKDSSFRFLEIGAGTGATTTGILDTIARPGPRFSSYTFTDVSPAFFPKAQERFTDHAEKMIYRALDIETSSQEETEKYDVVIAAHVLHATTDLSSTLANVHKLLKPNGKLILIEMTTPHKIETGFIFGTLDGWWRSSEDWRQENASAVFAEDQWDVLLQDCGFGGIENVFRDWDSDRCHGWSIMITSPKDAEPEKSPEIPTKSRPRPTILIGDDSKLELETAEMLKTSVVQSLHDADIVSFENIPSLDDLAARDFIILSGLESNPLIQQTSGSFNALQQVLTKSKSVLWVSSMGDTAKSESAPYGAMIEGLCRTCRSEDLGLPVGTLLLDCTTPLSIDHLTTQIGKVFTSFQASLIAGISIEPEYREVSGGLCINRLAQAPYLDQHVSERTEKQVSMQELTPNLPVKLEIATPGFLDTLQWVHDEDAYTPLEPSQVEIRVQAIGVNFKECLILLGRVDTDKLGSECSGYVHRVGSAVSEKHVKVGDRVALGSLDSYRTFVRAWDFQVIRIPDSLSFVDAAAIPTAFCTAYHSLVTVANLKKEENVLIHAAAGGTGQAAVQVAQHIGAEIFATVGSASKKKLLMDHYGIAEDHIFYSRDASFAQGIQKITGGRGVDVVLNSLSGKLLVASWEMIAPFGRFVEIGRRDIDSRGYLPMFPFLRNATFTGVDLATIVENRAQKEKYVLQTVFDLVEKGIYHPSYPVQSYSIDQTEQALRMLQSGKSSGKIVLEVQDGAVIPIVAGRDSNYRFRDDATYVITGGLGGIGRQIASWIARRGARHILLLARSNPESSREKLAAINSLRASGVNVQHKRCDISIHEDVARCIEEAASTMPPIKGCFQAAMVLRDRPFGTMTLEEWTDCIAPKVHGSANLADLLPADLDFLIMLSSTSGIFGNAGQSNYAAGNTFIDELARQLTSRGRKAIALDLGMVLGEGFVAENKDIHDRLLRLNLMQPLEQEGIFAILDYYCDPETKVDESVKGQIVTGLKLPVSVRQSGADMPEALQRRLFGALHQIASSTETADTNSKNSQDLSLLLRQATSTPEAGNLIAEALKAKLCSILGISIDERSVSDRMNSFGVDSLIALELRNWLMREARADLAVFEILGDSSLADIGAVAARKSEFEFGVEGKK